MIWMDSRVTALCMALDMTTSTRLCAWRKKKIKIKKKKKKRKKVLRKARREGQTKKSGAATK